MIAHFAHARRPLTGDELRDALAKPYRGKPLTERLAQRLNAGCSCWPKGHHERDCKERTR